MAKVIIFGVQDFAELAHYYLENDSEHEVVAFSVNEKYLPKDDSFHGLPVIAFEKIEKVYPPSEYSFFAPMSPLRMNRVREEVYLKIKSKKYNLISYISSKATIFNNVIGDVPDVKKRWDFYNTEERQAVYFNNQLEGKAIVGHWFEKDWFDKLTNFIGFNEGIYHAQDDKLIYSIFRFDYLYKKQ